MLKHIIFLKVTGDNILTAISVAHDCKLIRPGTTIIKVDADLIQDSYSSRLNVSYTIQENEKDGEVFISLIILSILQFLS